ncbi:MAG: transglycosylase SLT domain-containing protein [Neisseriaceae bacterium]|nr:transglycosylase SLT domain-containing protein [Neisseriaceae bacterium]
MGVAQVNRTNFKRYGLSEKNMFDTCDNLNAGAKILQDCFKQHQDWQKAYSCYYSGNAVTGFKHGYVAKVVSNLNKPIPTEMQAMKKTVSSQPIVFVPYAKATTQNKIPKAFTSVRMSLTQARLSSSF